MKSILVIGAGKFGHHLAEYLCEMDNDVMLVDKNETLIEVPLLTAAPLFLDDGNR